VLGVRGILRWTLLPGLIAALTFAFLAPAAKRVAGHRAPNFSASLAQLPKMYWHFLVGVFAHGIGDFAPTLLILRASQILAPRMGLGRAAAVSVALYTFRNFVSAAASYPAGALGDRIGKRRLLAGGYFIGAIAFAGFIFAPHTLSALVILFGVAGLHEAFVQSLEKSFAAELIPAAVRGSGFGVLATVNGVGDLVSSVAVGALWSSVGPNAGFLYAGFFCLLGALLVYFFVGRRTLGAA
jgi:MFS family permease